MNKKNKKQFKFSNWKKFFSIVLILLFFVGVAYAINNASTGFRATGGTTQVDSHGVCKKVINNRGEEVFVPTKAANEWSLFRTNLPSGVSLNECCVANYGASCGGSSCVNTGSVNCGGTCVGTSNKANGTACPGGTCSGGICVASSIESYDPAGDGLGGAGASSAGSPSSDSTGGVSATGGMSAATDGGTTDGGIGPDGGGDGGGGGGGGRVLCTEAYDRGMISEEMHQVDKDFAREYAETSVMRGYHSWALPLVRIIKRNDNLADAILPLAVEWSKHAAYKMGILPVNSEIGQVLVEIGFPLCEEIGAMMLEDGNLDYEFSEEDVEREVAKYLGDFDLKSLSMEEAKIQLRERLVPFLARAKEVYIAEKR